MLDIFALLLQQTDEGLGALIAGGYFLFCCCLVIFLALAVAGMWQTFTKAGKPGWAAIIPFYNIWVMMEIIGRPGWWLILFFIPIVQIVIGIITSLEMAKSFGRGIVFGILLYFFAPIMYLILGFGDAQYEGPAAGKAW